MLVQQQNALRPLRFILTDASLRQLLTNTGTSTTAATVLTAAAMSMDKLQPDARLALRLLDEVRREEASPWHSYIQLLPKYVPTGRHLPAEAVELIVSSALQQQVHMISRCIW